MRITKRKKKNAIYKGFVQPFIAHSNIEPLPKFQGILLLRSLEKREKISYYNEPFYKITFFLDSATFIEDLFLFDPTQFFIN